MSAPPVPAVDDPARWTGPVRRFPMTVEEGAVVAFRRAVGAPTTLDVPSTFAVVADAWDPDFARRPPPGRGWGEFRSSPRQDAKEGRRFAFLL